MSFPRIASSLSKSWNGYRAYHRTVAELSALRDRELADLGILRSDITKIARQSAY